MPLASLRCRSAWFDDGRLNQKVKIPTLKKLSVMSVGRKFKLRDQRIPKNVLELASQNQSSFCFGLEGRNTNSARASKTVRFTATRWCQGKSSSNVKSVSQSFGQIWLKTVLRSTWHRIAYTQQLARIFPLAIEILEMRYRFLFSWSIFFGVAIAFSV